MIGQSEIIGIIKKALFYILVSFICILVLTPFMFLIVYSLRTDSEIFSLDIHFIPKAPNLDAYKKAIISYEVGGVKFTNWALNSFLVCGIATLVCIYVSSMCGYGISRFHFFGRRPLWFIILFTQTMPWVVVLIPYYILLGKFGMLDKSSALSLSYLAVFTPISVWLFTGFFKNLPVEIEEAARIDGCSHFSVFYHIIMPLSVPGIAAIALFTFIIGWSDYLLASILISSVEKWTLPIGLSNFMQEHNILWAELTAMSTVITIPIVIIFLFLQKYLIDLLAGSIKQ